ncbi:hypothetical protein [Agriterribacter humi]|jgi:hypothetical protein|uniref:hypothetical protein n=1 Tax=Agriterribacter humi TaxID=1104781 RepID=UPI0012643B41|nr:hypothetical protein [Agriterribacter humi]
MKSIAFLILYSGYILSAFAQTSASDIKLSSLIKLDLGGQGIGLTYEPRLSKKMTSEINAGVGGGYYIDGWTVELNYLNPAFIFH